MNNETEKKLTELQHQQDLLREKVEASMKVMESENKVTLTKHEFAIKQLQLSNEKAIGSLRTDNEKAIGGLRTDNEKAIGGLRTDFGNLRTDFGDLRTDMEKNVNSITIRMIGIVALGVAILAFILK